MENKHDLTKGSITSNLLKASLPLIIAMMVETGYNIVDTIFVGRLGPEAIAAVTLAFPVMFAIMAIGGGLATGTSALVARFVGAKKFSDADNVAEHSILVAFLLSILFTILGILTINQVFSLLGANDIVLLLVRQYITVIYSGLFFLFMGMMSAGILRGLGDMKMQMKAMILGALTNIILDPILIFGFDMGIRGASVATITARGLGFIFMYQYLLRRKTVIRLSLSDFKFSSTILKKILITGVPMSLSQLSMAISWASLTKIASFFGPVAIAAYGVGFRVDTVVILPVLGIGMALITIVGQNLGAGKPNRAKKSLLSALGVASSVLLLFSSIFYAFPKPIFSIFSSNSLLISYGISYMRSLSPTYFFTGLGMIIGSAILGTGKPIPQLVITLLRGIVFAVPLSYLFSIVLDFGVQGIWWGMSIAVVLSGLVSLVWYHYIDWEKSASVDST